MLSRSEGGMFLTISSECEFESCSVVVIVLLLYRRDRRYETVGAMVWYIFKY